MHKAIGLNKIKYMKIKAIIVDDEKLARKRIFSLLKDESEITVVEECSTGRMAINSINEIKPSLIFLDIKLKDMSGFNVLEEIDNNIKPAVIFITAYDEYAIKAFEYFALDYLQKPFREDRFKKSINNAVETIKKNELNSLNEKIESIVSLIETGNKNKFNSILPIKVGNKTKIINIGEIKYIKASGYYAEIFTDTKKYLLRESLNNLIRDLNDSEFIRIHRSTIVNINSIQELISSNYGEVDVRMDDNELFRVSKSYRKDFSIKMGL